MRTDKPMLHHDIPPLIVNGLFTLGAAGVSGILSWWGGDRSGKSKVRADFVTEIERASTVVIKRLENLLQGAEVREALCMAQHQECVDTLAEMKAQIGELMAGAVPGYEMNPGRQDG